MGADKPDLLGRGVVNWQDPKHKVIIKQFAVGQFEVTRTQFQKFVSETNYKVGNKCTSLDVGVLVGAHIYAIVKNFDVPVKKFSGGFLNSGYLQKGNHPVVCINWYDAKAYVKWLSKKTGKGYRLLTEAEWEYVAKAGGISSQPFDSGRKRVCEYANSSGVLSWRPKEFCNDGAVHTAAIGSYKENQFGLFDIYGNVWEWVEDDWHNDYSGAPADGSAWLEVPSITPREGVIRGGAWNNDPMLIAPETRISQLSTARTNVTGFRVARTLSNQTGR